MRRFILAAFFFTLLANTAAAQNFKMNSLGLGTNPSGTAGDLKATSGAFSGLTSGQCVQAGTGGSLTSTGAACGTGSGTVTSVTGTSPITSSGGATPAIGIGSPYGATSYTLNGLLYGNSTSNIGVTAAGAAGTVLGGNTSAAPTMQQKTDKFVCGSIAVPTGGQELCWIPITVAETLPSSCTGSQASSRTAATASTTFTINQYHAGSITASDTVVWSASGTTGAFTCSGALTFAAGDALQIKAPATPDATIATLGITLLMNAGSL